MLLDEKTCATCHIIVNISNWWRGHKALVLPPSITGVNSPSASFMQSM